MPVDELRNEPNLSPFGIALEIIKEIEELTGAPINEFAEYSFQRVMLMVTPGVEIVVPDEINVHYFLTDQAAEAIAVEATGNPDAMAIVREVCACNTWAGIPVPKPFRPICRGLISGKYAPPAKRGPASGQRFGLFLVSYDVAIYLRDACGIPLVQYDGGPKNGAADYLTDALDEMGVEERLSTVRDWLSHKKHQKNRARAESILAMFRSKILEEVGVAKRRREWVVGPDAQLWPIGRVTPP